MSTLTLRSLRLVALLAVLLPLTGCLGTLFQNRLACTTDLEELHVLSKYGKLALASEIAEVDAKRTCHALLVQQVMERQAAAAAARKPVAWPMLARPEDL